MENSNIRLQSFFEKSESEIIQFLLKYWEMEPQENNTIHLIGTYEKVDKPDKNGKEYGFFTNVRNLNGDILYYPFKLGQVRIFSMHNKNFTTDFFQIDVDIAKEQVRQNAKNPFVLNLNKAVGKTSNEIMDRLENEKFIKTIFKETGFTQRDAKGLSNALKRIAGDLYTETERFIFELLQNADDLPNENNEVEVKFKLLKENLLFLHTGIHFTKDDVESISSIGDSTKRKDSEKTGYKGIGFKSVFSDANTVLINSGNFSFSFDRESPLYKEVNIEETPWEIKPIWTERYRYPKEVRNCEDFFKYSVAIDLEVNESKIDNYKKQIESLFKEPRFLLFLRNVKNISVDGLQKAIDIKKIGENNRFLISNNDIILSEWIIDDFEFNVSEEVKVLMENDKIVPEKLKSINKSKLSFASQIIKTQISKVHEFDSYLFTYLPTNVNEYKFPFLINADFLTTANRQSIHSRNNWNLYIFEQIGYLCFKWMASLAQRNEYVLSCTNLIPNKFNVTEPIHESFNKGFDKAINEIAFIPNVNNDLNKVNESIVDFTGLSELLGYDSFIKLVAPKLNLVINELENKKVLKTIGVQSFEYQDLIDLIDLLSNSDFQNWLKEPENNFNFIKFLSNSEQDKIKNILVENSIIITTNDTFSVLKNTYEQLPIELDFLHLPTIHSLVLEKLKNEGIELNFKEFNPNTVLTETKQNLIGDKINTNDDLLNFWNFVYDYWNVINSDNSSIEILKKCPISANKVDFLSNCECVLISKVYFNDKLLDIFQSLELNDTYFISNNYINENRTKDEWFKIFKKCGAKSDLQNLIAEIINKLEVIKSDKHIVIAKQLFKYWKDTTEGLTAIQLNKIKNHLKLNCIDGISRISNECIVGDYYTDLRTINDLLQEIELGNQLSSDYGKGTEWKTFFNKVLGVKMPTEKQDVLDEKLQHFTDVQAKNEGIDYHYSALIAISKLHETRNTVNLRFDKIKNIKLLDKNNLFIDCDKLHFCNLYKPKLKLEGEKGIAILNKNYHPLVKFAFLKYCGVRDNFEIEKSEMKRNEIPADYLNEFENIAPNIGLNAIKWGHQHRLKNHIKLSYYDLLLNVNYCKDFWLGVTKNSDLKEMLMQNSEYRYHFSPVLLINYTIYCIQKHKTIINLNNQLTEPTKLYSQKLQNYISDKSKIVGIDFTGNEDLEEAIGISQKLSCQHCIDLLTKQSISLAEIEDLKIIEILKDYAFSVDDLSEIQILNEKEQWKKPEQLYISENSELDSESILHPIFVSVASSLGVKTVSENELVLNFKDEELITDIHNFFNVKAKFIAFQINQDNYLNIKDEITERISLFSFYETAQIWKELPNTNYREDLEFSVDESEAYFSNNWKTNDLLLEFIFDKTDLESKLKNWFKNVMQWDEKKIIQNLEDTFGETPFTISENIKQNDIISNYTTEIQSIIKKKLFGVGGNQSIDNQINYNQIAKIAVIHHLGVIDDLEGIDLNDYNNLQIDNQQYKVYSSLGEFAHIQSTALLELKANTCKIAIYYGGKDIKIVNTLEELLRLNENFLFEFQANGDQGRLIEFLEKSNTESFRMLLPKFTNVDSRSFTHENTQTEIDNKASDIL